jgi:hypothetical protein
MFFDKTRNLLRLTILVLVTLLIGCKNEKKDIPKVSFHEGYKVVITLPAGESLDDESIAFLPAPFNIAAYKGHNKDLKTIVIADRIEKNKQIKILPVAFLSTSNGMIVDRYIVSVPADSTRRSIPVSDYADFSVNHYGVKNMIENWFKYKNNNERSLKVQWSSEQTAIEHIISNEELETK